MKTVRLPVVMRVWVARRGVARPRYERSWYSREGERGWPAFWTDRDKAAKGCASGFTPMEVELEIRLVKP